MDKDFFLSLWPEKIWSNVAILNNQPIIFVCFLCQNYHKINNNCTIIQTNNATYCIVFTGSAIMYQINNRKRVYKYGRDDKFMIC